MTRMTETGALVLVAAALVASSCGRQSEPRASGTLSSPTRAGLPSPAPPGVIVLERDGLGIVSFGDPMRVVSPRFIELLGPPTDVQQMHGDMPLGYDGLDSTARWVFFGDLRLLFGDWAESDRAGVMHLLGWDVWGPHTTNGTSLATAEGIRVGSSVRDLEAEYGSALHLPERKPGVCEGPPWYFGIDPDPSAFRGSLTAAPSHTDSRVRTLHAGSLREGVWVDECW
jgi:hypothetical protein